MQYSLNKKKSANNICGLSGAYILEDKDQKNTLYLKKKKRNQDELAKGGIKN